MIRVEEAQRVIRDIISPYPGVCVPLKESVGRVLAKSVISPFDLPLFDNAAMDGYALRAEDTVFASMERPLIFSVVGVASAGSETRLRLEEGQAVRILTGAMVSDGATAVVAQEDVLTKAGQIVVSEPLERHLNIRFAGEEIHKGDLLLRVGTRLSPAAIGLLASVGITEVPIISPPRVALVITGSELVHDTSEIGPGKIFDANTPLLEAALRELNIVPVLISHCVDQRDHLLRTLSAALEQADMVIVSGGVSVGEFDFVKDVAAECAVHEIFWKVKQKPGKPLFFGSRMRPGMPDQFVFGLPGNPASALVCYYEYVRLALFCAMGATNLQLPSVYASLAQPFRKRAGMQHFLKGKFRSETGLNQVSILDRQGSHMLSSFAEANALIVVPEEVEALEKGDEVEIHLLPQ